MTETDLVRTIIKWVKGHKGDAWHVHGSSVQRAGEPDIDGWFPVGFKIIHFKVECKIGKGVVSPIQAARLGKYREAHYATGVAYSLDDFKDIIEEAIILEWYC